MNALFLLIAALPFCDFLQNGFTAFAAPSIMGGLAAGPQEYSLAATVYAAAAVGTIALHRVLLGALGWRSYLLASLACLAAGSLVCAASDSMGLFTAGRALMALGCGASLTSGRVLVHLLPQPARRLLGLRFFAAGLAWGAVAGPALAALAVADAGWRSGFAGLAAIAVLAALLVLATRELRDQPAFAPPALGPRDLLGLGLLLAGSVALLLGSTRATFASVAGPGWSYAAAAIAVPALALFVANHAGPSARLLALRRVAQRRYLAGLAAFVVAYCIIGADNTALPFLLRTALDLPLPLVAADVGLGAFAGVLTWIVVARLLPRRPGPWGYYAVAFTLLALSAWGLAGVTSEADVQRAVVPALLFHGAFVILVLSTTAMQAFRSVSEDEALSLANQLKNIVAQLGLALGSAGASLLLQARGSLHYGVLAESSGEWSTAFDAAVAQLTSHFSLGGATNPHAFALAHLAQQAQHEALLRAAGDYFRGVAYAAGCTGASAFILALALRRAFD